MKNRNTNSVQNVFISQVGVLLLGVISSFIIPYVLSTEQYGKWQVFLLYVGYIGFFMLGFTDGIHLNYADKEYTKENFPIFKLFMRVAVGLGSIWCVVVIIFTLVFMKNSDNILIYCMLAVNIVIFSIIGFSTHINQITMRFHNYSLSMILEKLVFVSTLIIILILNKHSFVYIIVIFTISRIIVAIYNIVTQKDIFDSRSYTFRNYKNEIRSNFIDGFYLMIAIVANSLIIGSSRILSERLFSVAEFGIYSFAFSITSIALQISISLSTVFYPILKRTCMLEFYRTIKRLDTIMMYYGVAMLLSYFPFIILINTLYSKYSPLLIYLPFMYPIFILQGKYSLIILNTFKVLKRERTLLYINIFGVMLNVSLTLFVQRIIGGINSFVISSMIAYILWYYITCVILHRISGWGDYLSIFNDIPYIIVFIVVTYCFGYIFGFLIYLLIAIFILFIKRAEILKTLNILKTTIKQSS